MGAKPTKDVERYRNEAFPPPVKVDYLPGVEVIRQEEPEEEDHKEKAQPKHKKKARKKHGHKHGGHKARKGAQDGEVVEAHRLPVQLERLLQELKRKQRADKEAKVKAEEQRLHNERLSKRELMLALSWGWGGEGRTGRGTFTYEELSPQQVLNHARARFVDVATGKRHSLLVTQDGLVLSTGEGRGQQLGGTRLGSEPVILRRMPVRVLPSGTLKHGCDLKIAQVQAGATTSYAREVGDEDVAATVFGLQQAVAGIEAQLAHDVPGDMGLLELRAHLIEEARTLGRQFGGDVVSWGESRHGALGLEKGVTMLTKPTVIPALVGKRVRRLAAGRDHVLAVTVEGVLYTWGRGNHGRLGLGDYLDRWVPCPVTALGGHKVTGLIGAGQCHSLAVCEEGSGRQTVYCWGKGANGRVGDARSMNRKLPTAVTQFPDSVLSDYRVAAVALGGAHTLVAFHKTVKVSMGNPWGVVSRVYAWGCNTSGQLGRDHADKDYSVPQRVLLPEYEIITSLAAGKVHSSAISVYGEMFVWGRGFYGETGLGDHEFRYKPTKLPGNKVWLKAAGGDYHSMALAIKERMQSRRQTERSKFDYAMPNAYLGLPTRQAQSLGEWVCVRQSRAAKGSVVGRDRLFACITCNLPLLCKHCAKSCHSGHELTLYKGDGPRTLCRCGLQPVGGGTCRLWPCIVEDVPQGHEHVARILQRLYRGHRVRKHYRQRHARFLAARRAACEQVWQQCVLQPIFDRAFKVMEAKRQAFERATMTNAATHSTKAALYLKLQMALQLMHSQAAAIDAYVTKGRCWPPVPTRLRKPVLPSPFYYFTRQQLRQFLRTVPLHRHPPHLTLLRMTADLPAYGKIERPTRMTPDPDLAVILSSARRQQEREQLRKRKPRPPPKATGEAGQTQSLTQSLTQSVKDKKDGKEGQEGKGASSKGSKDGKAPADTEHGSEGKGSKGKGKSAKTAKEDLKKLQADLEANAEAREARERLRRKRHRQYVRQRRSTIAAPEGLYARLRKFEGQSRVRIEIARRQSFDLSARVDKSKTKVDLDVAARLKSIAPCIHQSLHLAHVVKLDEDMVTSLSKGHALGRPEGSRAYQVFARKYASPALEHDLAQIVRPTNMRRRYSFAAPERLHQAKRLWEEGLQQEDAIFTAATRENYPTRRHSWVWRMDKITPEKRLGEVVESRDWDKESERLDMQARLHGWDIDMKIPELIKPKVEKATMEETKPAAAEAAEAAATSKTEDANALPWPWMAVLDESSNSVYYYNQETGVSSWEHPTEGVSSLGTQSLESDTHSSSKSKGQGNQRKQYGQQESVVSYQSSGSTQGGGFQQQGGYFFGADHQTQNNYAQSGYAGQEGYPSQDSPWSSYQDEHGNWYWYNVVTGETQAAT